MTYVYIVLCLSIKSDLFAYTFIHIISEIQNKCTGLVMHNIKIEFKNKGSNYSYKEGISSKAVENEDPPE